MQNTTRKRYLTIAALTLTLAAAGMAAGPASKATGWVYDFHSVVPLGADALRLQPAKRIVYLLASAESPGFEGIRRHEQDGKVEVTGPNGEPVSHYPEAIDFRVTASAKKGKLMDTELEPFSVDGAEDVNQYLLGLKFRLKIFHGIEMRLLEPDAVKLIGVPSDVPYEERIYRVSFNLGQVPAQDRLVLEVLDPSGTRVSKFHLEVF
jgi:hypothetical protein